VPQCPLQGRLHLHLLELCYGKVQVLQGFGSLVGVKGQSLLGVVTYIIPSSLRRGFISLVKQAVNLSLNPAVG